MGETKTPALPRGSWLDSDAHRAWLEAEGRRLLAFHAAARLAAGGFGWLDAKGGIDGARGADTLFTARITHCFAVASMRGIPGAKALARHGIDALRGDLLRDRASGGWFENAAPAPSARKSAYIHMFVALAASSGHLGGCEGAGELLAEIADLVEWRFWSEAEGRVVESYAADWSDCEAYRGGNSNMHAVEAFLALHDATGQPRWLDRALSIVERLIHEGAALGGYHVVEHYRADWTPWPDYNAETPAHEFRPFGITPGHAFEWSRLVLGVEGALARLGRAAPAWLVTDAIGLFDAAAAGGWAPDGRPGLVYTIDRDGKPVVDSRLHWPVTEGIAAAAMLVRRTGEARFERWYRTFWDYAETHLIDRENGSWRHELDAFSRPAETIWRGKPDLYHAYQATVLPRLLPAPTLALAAALGLDADGGGPAA